MRYAYFLPALLFLIPVESPAQQRERVGFTYTYEDRAGLSEGGTLALRELEIRTGYPVWRDGGRVLTPGVRWTRYDFLTPDRILGDKTVYSLRFPIRFAQSSSNGWSAFFLLTPSVRSDFESLTTDDLGLNALAIASRPLGEHWSVSGGIVYGQDFGRTRFYPALGATWRPDDAWSIELLFPRPRIAYRADERLAWTLALEPGGDQWNVELPHGSRDVALSEFRAGLGVDWRIHKRVRVIGQAGLVFNRELEIRDGRRKEGASDVDDTGFIRLGFALE